MREKRKISFSEAVRKAGAEGICLLPYEKAEDIAATRRILAGITPGQPVSVIIGPEGGFSEEEAREAEAAGFQPISLGRRILRTETAGMAVLAMLVLFLDT